MRIAFVFPGQGSQSVGMLAGYAGNAAVEDTMKRASAALGQDQQALIAEGPAETLGITVNTQPVLLATSVAFWNAWRAAGGPVPAVMAGHSLGEYSALCAAGAFSLEDGVKLVRFRAEAMQSAVPVGVGGMAAIIGLSDADVLAACREAASEGGVVEAVNFNSPGQVVIAGEKAADKKEYSQRSQDLAGFPSSIEGIGTGRRPVEGDGRAEQTGSESCRTAENPGVFFPAAGFGDTLPEDIDDEQDAYGALKHGVGEHLKNMESCEGSGQRTEEQRPKSRYPAVTEVHEGKTSVHGRIENAAQGNDHMHGKNQGCRGNGDHGASYARHSGDEAACKPADKNEE